jgi:hypothetical protein
MRHSSRANTAHTLNAALPRSNGEAGPNAGTIQHDLTQLLRIRLAMLAAALRYVEELRNAAAKGLLQPCNPPIH